MVELVGMMNERLEDIDARVHAEEILARHKRKRRAARYDNVQLRQIYDTNPGRAYQLDPATQIKPDIIHVEFDETLKIDEFGVYTLVLPPQHYGTPFHIFYSYNDIKDYTLMEGVDYDVNGTVIRFLSFAQSGCSVVVRRESVV